MKRILIIIAGLFSIAYGQRYQTMPAEGYGPIKRMRVDSVLNIPIGDTTRKRNLSDGKDSGQIRWFNGSLYVYNGAYWAGVSGGGGGITRTELQDTAAAIRADIGTSPDLQGAINNGATITNDVTINATNHNIIIDSVNILLFKSVDTTDGESSLISLSVGGNGINSDITMTKLGVGITSQNTFSVSSGNISLSSDSLFISTDKFQLQLPSAQPGYVLKSSDTYGTATWQPDSDIDTTSLSNRINARALLTGAAFTGSVGIGTSASASAAFEISSTTHGVLLPRMTTTQRDAISSPATNLIVNNTTTGTVDQYSGSAWYSIAGDFSRDLRMAQAMGSPLKAGPLFTLSQLSTGTSLQSTRSFFNAVWVDKPITITGAAFYQATQGNFTGNNYNGIALYSYSGGTATLIDSTARNENIWKGTSGTWQQAAFAGGSRKLQPGLYYLLFLYSSSAQTTAPSIGASNPAAGTSNYLAPLTTNSARFYGGVATGVTTPPTSQAVSAWTSITTYFGGFLY